MTQCHILLANVFFAPFTYGGATIVAEEVAKALLRRTSGDIRYKVTAVSLCCRHELADYTIIKSERGGIRNFVINVPPRRSYAKLYDNPDVTRLIATLMDDLQPDLVHAHCLQDMGAGILQAAKDRDIPSILSVHDFWWLCERQFMIRPDQTYCGSDPVHIDRCRSCVTDFAAAKARSEYLNQMARLPSRITFPSRFAHDLSVSSGFAKDRGVIWENGVMAPREGFATRRVARRSRDPRPTFGFVGGPSPIKGWPQIRAAFKSLKRQDFRVLVVDGSADESWWIDHAFQDLPGEWEVYPRFDQAEMDTFYSEIDVLLFMSQWKETFGLTVREALARAIPVIQTDSGGSTEYSGVVGENLIPIGAPTRVLADRLNAAIDQHPHDSMPLRVTSYDMQAAAFDQIVRDVRAEVS